MHWILGVVGALLVVVGLAAAGADPATNATLGVGGLVLIGLAAVVEQLDRLRRLALESRSRRILDEAGAPGAGAELPEIRPSDLPPPPHPPQRVSPRRRRS